MSMVGPKRLALLLATAWLALHAPASRGATAEQLAHVHARLQEVAAPWCERLTERDAEGRKRCTIPVKTVAADRARMANILGTVYVTEPMLATLSEPELALVAGHEFAHIVLGHAVISARLGNAPAPLLRAAEFTNVPPRDGAPEDRHAAELDADRLGLFFAGLAGYPVRQLAAGWRDLVARLPLGPRAADDQHPPDAERAQQLQLAADEFCARGQRGDALMPALDRLQPRYEADVDVLREQQGRLPILSVCRLPAST